MTLTYIDHFKAHMQFCIVQWAGNHWFVVDLLNKISPAIITLNAKTPLHYSVVFSPSMYPTSEKQTPFSFSAPLEK